MADTATIEGSSRPGSHTRDEPPAAQEREARMIAERQQPNTAHVIAYRVSLPLLGQSYYFALFSGHEQRRPDRIEAEGLRKPWTHTIVSVLAVIGGISTALMCTLTAGYLFKSMLGIDLFDEHFILHHIFFS